MSQSISAVFSQLPAMALAVILGNCQSGLAQGHQHNEEKFENFELVSGISSTSSPLIAGGTRSTGTNSSLDAYILGPGDALLVELLDVPEYSGVFTSPDGSIYVRLRSLFVEGFTIEELRTFLTKEFKAYVRDPQVFVSPAAYRPIRVYVGGEVARPGYYNLVGQQEVLGVAAGISRNLPGPNNSASQNSMRLGGVVINPANQAAPRIAAWQLIGACAYTRFLTLCVPPVV